MLLICSTVYIEEKVPNARLKTYPCIVDYVIDSKHLNMTIYRVSSEYLTIDFSLFCRDYF